MPDLPQTIFHLVDARNWTGVQREGLLCATDLVRKAHALDQAPLHLYRQVETILPDGVVLRDQAPMPPTALGKGLDAGLEPADWYRLVNDCVFFWFDVERLQRHLKAQKDRPQILLSLNARAIASAYEAQACVTPFNIGAAYRKPAMRGLRTLVPVKSWREDGWAHEAADGRPSRAASHKPAEFVVRASVPDAMAYVVDQRRIGGF